MSSDPIYDVAILGGGIIGCATAMTLSKTKGLRIVLIEKENRLAAHQTGNNSGVIHSGLYYKPGSLKAQNCVKGNKALYEFCQIHDIPFEKCGKLVVAADETESSRLNALEQRGIQNGLTGLGRLSPSEIKKIEPHAAGVDALYVPQTGIIDYIAVTQTYARLFIENGGQIRLGTFIRKIQSRNRTTTLFSPQGNPIRCRYLINCGGLYSDRIGKMCGVSPGLKIVPFRGEYFHIKKSREHLVKHLIYPVPDPRFPFLGVHFTRMIHGGAEAGPNAVLALKREGYGKLSISLGDMFDTLTYGGFWKLTATHWKTGMGEGWRSLSKKAFTTALKKLIPEINTKDLQTRSSGVRAQALLPSGELCDDFRLLTLPDGIHVLNAPSPAATASIPISQTIAKTAVKHFNLK